MLKKTFNLGISVMVLALTACSMLQQPPAPMESGSTSNAAVNNPPDVAPYTPPADNSVYTPPANNSTYTPPPAPDASSTGFVPNYSPVDINATTHTVQRGDTIYNISKRYQIAQNDLRAWNNLSTDSISIGQVLRVKPEGVASPTQPVVQQPVVHTTPTPPPTDTSNNISTSSTVRTTGGLVWQRPVPGAVLEGFGGSNKGINYGGVAGQPVVAAADGKVVYAGSGLRGYGNLVIIQHNKVYLTAYGNNQRLLVKEGQQVKRGQQIALMGNSDAKRTQLHFELRENGKPMNPTRFIP